MLIALVVATSLATSYDQTFDFEVGFALSHWHAPDDADVNHGLGGGGYVKVAYAYALTEWLSPRAYAGFDITGRGLHCDSCDLRSALGFGGLAVRLTAPIPWIAPFVEGGIGAAFGTIHTKVDNYVDATYHGGYVQVPFSLGLSVGHHHQADVVLGVLYHPRADQIVYIFGFGIREPL